MKQRTAVIATFVAILIGLIALNVARSVPQPLVATPASPSLQTSATPAAGASRVAFGQQIFTANCVNCHNQQINNLAPAVALRSDEQLRSTITNGLQQGILAMPAFGNQLRADEIEALIAYLRSTAQP